MSLGWLDNLAFVMEQIVNIEGGAKKLKPRARAHSPPSFLTSHAIALAFYKKWELEKAQMQKIIDQ